MHVDAPKLHLSCNTVNKLYFPALDATHPAHSTSLTGPEDYNGKGEQGAGAWDNRWWEVGGERAGSESSKRVGSEIEMQNTNFCHILIR